MYRNCIEVFSIELITITLTVFGDGVRMHAHIHDHPLPEVFRHQRRHPLGHWNHEAGLVGAWGKQTQNISLNQKQNNYLLK